MSVFIVSLGFFIKGNIGFCQACLHHWSIPVLTAIFMCKISSEELSRVTDAPSVNDESGDKWQLSLFPLKPPACLEIQTDYKFAPVALI